jgi:hypothetical protein
MAVLGATKFESLFRSVAELDVDKEDVKRYQDFLNRKIGDLLVRAQAVANANSRDIIEPQDVPVTKGFRQCMHEFKRIDDQMHIKPLIDELTNRPPLDLAYSYDTETMLPELAGGLTVALARAFKILDPKLKNPHTEQWERAFNVFDLLL